MNQVFESGPSKICGKQPLKNLKGYGLLLRNVASGSNHLLSVSKKKKIKIRMNLNFHTSLWFLKSFIKAFTAS